MKLLSLLLLLLLLAVMSLLLLLLLWHALRCWQGCRCTSHEQHLPQVGQLLPGMPPERHQERYIEAQQLRG
jgi:hypothetical protein